MDLSKEESLDYAEKFMSEFSMSLPNSEYKRTLKESPTTHLTAIVGSKTDLPRKVAHESITKLARKYKTQYFEFSTQNLKQMEALFATCANYVLAQQQQNNSQ